MHLLNNFTRDEETARLTFTVGFLCGFLFVGSTLFGFSVLRRNGVTWEVVIYGMVISGFFSFYLARQEVMALVYSSEEGWFSVNGDPYFWNSFTIFLTFANLKELVFPLGHSYFKAEPETRPRILILLVGILLATFSAGLLQVLTLLGLPNVLRFLVTGISFFIYFYYLNKYPFLGFHDGSQIHEVLVADSSGLPIYAPLTLESHSFLASGAIIGVNGVLEEISRNAGVNVDGMKEKFKMVELGNNAIFVASVRDYQIVFNFSNPSGITLPKLKSLSRVFWRKLGRERLIRMFEKDLKTFFPAIRLEKD